jgi:hypothetical protein
MKITLALDDELVTRAREVARRQGTTLNDLIRRYLEIVAGHRPGQAVADDLRLSWAQHPGHSGGGRFCREHAYKDRLD